MECSVCKKQYTTKEKLENHVKKRHQAITISNTDGLTFLETIADGSVDLILTDPPYIISKETGMDKHAKLVADATDDIYTEEDWNIYRDTNELDDDPTQKQNYIKYGTIYGRKYGVITDYGEWDRDFTMETLDTFVGQYYKKLRKGGTCIIFFDIWKISYLKEMMEKHKFKQIRLIEWIKTNTVPINSSVNYLSNCREIALLGIKGSKPVFNSKYDKGIYNYPIQSGKDRCHPTQKSVALFNDLVRKHSNEGDLVLDTFLGGGTTAVSCFNTKRRFVGCEISKEYYDKVLEILEMKRVKEVDA